MNRFLLGALAMGAVFVLTSFALTRPPAAKTGPAWTVSQYQLDRAFRLPLVINPNQPMTMQVPTGGGFIISQVRSTNGQASNFTITVNGVSEVLAGLAWNADEHVHD